MPSQEVLASWQHVEQRALDLRAVGLPGTLPDLRVRAYLDLLQEQDTRATLSHPGTGPRLAALVTITVPLGTLQGRSQTPGEVAGFGLLDAGTACDLSSEIRPRSASDGTASATRGEPTTGTG